MCHQFVHIHASGNFPKDRTPAQHSSLAGYTDINCRTILHLTPQQHRLALIRRRIALQRLQDLVGIETPRLRRLAAHQPAAKGTGVVPAEIVAGKNLRVRRMFPLTRAFFASPAPTFPRRLRMKLPAETDPEYNGCCANAQCNATLQKALSHTPGWSRGACGS
jgi:hypothetical protein